MLLSAVELGTAPVVVLVVVLASVALLAVWLLPRRQARRWRAEGIEGKELATLENGARGTLVQILGGVALILTFVATWLQIADTRKASDRTLALSSAQQEAERFTTAVQQLASDKVEVRLGGIFGLQQAARDEPRRRAAVAGLMVAYLKGHHRLRRNDARALSLEARNQQGRQFGGPSPCALTEVHAWPDTQAAVGALLAVPSEVRGAYDLSGADLIGVQARGADLARADLRGASLAGAMLEGADFHDARLTGADLRRACVRGAGFDGVLMNFPILDGADISGADLSGANMTPGAVAGTRKDRCTLTPQRPKPKKGCDGP